MRAIATTILLESITKILGGRGSPLSIDGKWPGFRRYGGSGFTPTVLALTTAALVMAFSVGALAAETSAPPFAVSQGGTQICNYFNNKPYHYNHQEVYTLQKVVKGIEPAPARALVVWGQNMSNYQPFLPQGIKRALGPKWKQEETPQIIELEQEKTPLIIGACGLPRIALTPVEFTPCNDALDFTVFGGSGVEVKSALIEKAEGGLEQQADVIVEKLKPGPNDKLLLLIISKAAAKDAALAPWLDNLRKLVPAEMIIVGIIGGVPFYQAQFYNNGIAAISLAGPFTVTTQGTHPYEALGAPLKITEVKAGKITKMDGKEAKDAYAAAIGASYEGLKNGVLLRRFPLGIKINNQWAPVKTYGMDNDGGIKTDPAMPEGAEVVIMKRNDDKALALAEGMVKGATPSEASGWQIIINNSLYWDGWTKAEKDYQLLQEAGGKKTATNLIYSDDGFIVEQGGLTRRGLFNVLWLSLH